MSVSPLGHVDWYMINTRPQWATVSWSIFFLVSSITLADNVFGVFGRILPFEEGYCKEYITDIPPIHHWQTTDMLPTADRKVAINTSTNIKCVVIASIDRHSIECWQKLKVCLQRCQWCVNRGVDQVSIVGWLRSIDRHSIAVVNSTYDLTLLASWLYRL